MILLLLKKLVDGRVARIKNFKMLLISSANICPACRVPLLFHVTHMDDRRMCCFAHTRK
jgi:hypothetical protein